MLDELAYTYDLLIFIATGNLDNDYVTNVTELNDTGHDLTSYTLPAYYTRKFHVDYAEEINGSKFFKSQMNKNIFKPDILMAGGNCFNPLLINI